MLARPAAPAVFSRAAAKSPVSSTQTPPQMLPRTLPELSAHAAPSASPPIAPVAQARLAPDAPALTSPPRASATPPWPRSARRSVELASPDSPREGSPYPSSIPSSRPRPRPRSGESAAPAQAPGPLAEPMQQRAGEPSQPSRVSPPLAPLAFAAAPPLPSSQPLVFPKWPTGRGVPTPNVPVPTDRKRNAILEPGPGRSPIGSPVSPRSPLSGPPFGPQDAEGPSPNAAAQRTSVVPAPADRFAKLLEKTSLEKGALSPAGDPWPTLPPLALFGPDDLAADLRTRERLHRLRCEQMGNP
jgi:hypothetical protein